MTVPRTVGCLTVSPSSTTRCLYHSCSGCSKWNCLQTLPNVSWGTKSSPGGSHLPCHEDTAHREVHLAWIRGLAPTTKMWLVRHVRGPLWKWMYQHLSSFHETATPADNLTAATWETLGQVHPGKLLPDSCPAETVWEKRSLLNVTKLCSILLGGES